MSKIREPDCGCPRLPDNLQGAGDQLRRRFHRHPLPGLGVEDLAALGRVPVLAQQQSSLAGQSLRLIGNEALCERYRVALAQFGCTQAELVRQATERGLWRVASQAGLVKPAAHAARAG